MSSLQYTIRAIPPKVDEALRSKAKQASKSLNQIVVEALKHEVGFGEQSPTYHDLDWFMGSGSNDKIKTEAKTWLDNLPSNLDDNFR